MGFLRRRTIEVKCHFITLYQGYTISMLFLTVGINLDLPDEAVFIRFLPHKITLFPLLHAVLFESESPCAACI